MAGGITFRHLRLTYTGIEIVLPDFSLDIKPRETVALVGHTGAGKSSVARLLARFYEFQGGQLLIDGRDIRTLNLNDYRRHTAWCRRSHSCSPVRCATTSATAGRMRAMMRWSTRPLHIGQGDWLAGLPNGLDTDVGERGGNLSMGQRQLVALARVLLKNPAIFILDEATASVDPFTETQIQEGLDTIMEDRTAIVIAHRLSTVKHADRIIVMKNGRIHRRGQPR